MADSDGEKGNLRMLSGSFYIARDKGPTPQGDDSHFICEEKQTIGLADGVGGWSRHGVDAGSYARQLMNNSLLAIRSQPHRQVDPMKVLDEAYTKTKAEGSSTACIITLQKDSKLNAVNLGDSGFMVMRQGAVIYRSPTQQYSFNTPYQLGNYANSDKPWQGQVIKLAVEAGDVVVAGTDGLFDNLSESRILEVAATGIKQGLHPEEVAWSLAQEAYLVSMDTETITPFMKDSMMAGIKHIGGKQDDITVIVSLIFDT
ncbi:hypothetical protein PTKIN_Ptkin05aG0072800 [Pterospermum kingtungense]